MMCSVKLTIHFDSTTQVILETILDITSLQGHFYLRLRHLKLRFHVLMIG